MLRGRLLAVALCLLILGTFKPKGALGLFGHGHKHELILHQGGMRMEIRLPKASTKIILNEFNDLNQSKHVWGILQLVGMDPSQRCENCMKSLFNEANRLNHQHEANQYFPF